MSSENIGTILDLTVEDTLSVKPDTVIITITIGNKEGELISSYEKAKKKLTKYTVEIMDFLKLNGILEDKINVKGDSVYPEYEYESVEESTGLLGNKKTRVVQNKKLLGYKYNNIVTVSDYAEAELGELYCKLIAISYVQNIGIEYIVIDIEDSKNKLISQIMKKARHKADLVAEANGLVVDKVLNIDFNVTRDVDVMHIDNLMMTTYDEEYLDFEDDINREMKLKRNKEKKITETVNIKYLLK